MREFEAQDRGETIGDRFSRFTRWLSRRPIESWGFFIAGIILARIFF